MASKIDRVIDQLEETNRKIRELQFFLIRSGALSAINPVAGKVAGAVVAPAEAVNEQLANAYFSTLRETADVLQTRNDNIPMLIEASSPTATITKPKNRVPRHRRKTIKCKVKHSKKPIKHSEHQKACFVKAKLKQTSLDVRNVSYAS